jgi:uncharacterized protein involved in response to NO
MIINSWKNILFAAIFAAITSALSFFPYIRIFGLLHPSFLYPIYTVIVAALQFSAIKRWINFGTSTKQSIIPILQIWLASFVIIFLSSFIFIPSLAEGIYSIGMCMERVYYPQCT